MARLPGRNASVSLWHMSDETRPKLQADIDELIAQGIKPGRPRLLTPEQEDRIALEYAQRKEPVKVIADLWGLNFWTCRRAIRRAQARAQARLSGRSR